MPSLKYTGEPGRYYPDLCLTPEPGNTYELPTFPLDGRWVRAESKTAPAVNPTPEEESK